MTDPVALRVVVADDDADIRALVTISVKRAGFEVVASVEDGDMAWAAIQELTPDLAILDVAMPGLSGLDVCRLVQADPAVAGIPVLLLSAAVDEASRAAGREAGARDYLAKPFSPRALVTWLSTECLQHD
ncbi:MAG: Transcriptional regulatory protein yycF [Glaciihabitans sp.]|nr:Transcriptional regulatory protein yycF [Glaciihabitans sp.]